MIAIETASGELVKTFKSIDSLDMGFHKLFGFIGEDSAAKRLQQRQKTGYEFDKDKWLCKFSLKQDSSGYLFSQVKDCEIAKIDTHVWSLKAKHGEFVLRDFSTGKQSSILDSIELHEDKADWMNGGIEKLLFIIFLIIPILYFQIPTDIDEVIEEKKELKPITVKIIEQKQAVNISSFKPSIKVKPLTKSQKAKRAVQRNLGFLGLVGSKDLSKAVGGVPQKLKKASAGAGAGGDAGSGGEVLTGLGKGLKKTTVGNTGVAGLGGIGTKGAGGGAGGYGNTMVASGEGKGISSIAMGSNNMVLEGGLSRYAINATIAKYLSQVRRCYETQLNKQVDKSMVLEGLVTVAFQINGSGGVNFSKIKNTSLNSPPVEKCITQKMMGWKFPKTKGGVNVNINYPFMLRPVGT